MQNHLTGQVFFYPKIPIKNALIYTIFAGFWTILLMNLMIYKKRQEFINFKNNFKAKDFSHSVIKNMWGLIETSDIPINVVYDLFDGVESDLEDIIKFETEKDLLVYSYRVAGTVGIMMAKVLNVKKNFALKGAIDLGIAMQLTNISRDVIEDKSQNRFYIKSDFEKD